MKSVARTGVRRRFAASHLPLLGLRYGILAILILIVAAVGVALLDGSRRPESRPLAELATAEGVAQRSLNLDATRTREGLPALRVAAREAYTYREGRTELHEVEVTLFGDSGEETQVNAPLAISGESGDEGWSFRNGVRVRTQDGLVLNVPELNYSRSPEEVTAAGEVGFEQGDLRGSARGLRYLVARRRLEFLSQVEILSGPETGGFDRIRARSAVMEPRENRVTFRDYRATSATGEILEGQTLRVFMEEKEERRRTERVEGGDGFLISSPEKVAMPGLLGAGGRSVSGVDFVLTLEEDGQVGAFVARREVKVVLEQPEGEPRRLSSGLLEIDFVDGAAVALTAEEEAEFTLPREQDSPGAPALLSAGTVVASLDPNSGAVARVDASGQARAVENGRSFQSEIMTYKEEDAVWILRGTEEEPARAADGRVSITARRVEIRREARTLEARGGVKTVTRSADEGKDESATGGRPAVDPGAGAFFRGGEGPLHGISDLFQFDGTDNTALYRGNARLWRSGQSIEAAEIDLRESAGLMEARGGVVARMPAREQAAGGTPRMITVSSTDLRYLKEDGEARFTGSVRAQAGDMRIEASTLTAKTGQGEGVREIHAEKKVRILQGTRIGDADRVVADLHEDRTILYGIGRLASIQDQSTQQIVRGAVLTYEGAADRILVESESGGRTWITLEPRSGKGRVKSDPESPR